MPIRVQDKPSGLYVAEGGGFTAERDEAARFASADEAETLRRATLRSIGPMQKHWDLRVRFGPDEEK